MSTTDEQPTAEITAAPKVSDESYEKMCLELYSYRVGAIEFLELLVKLEEMLSMRSPPGLPNISETPQTLN